MRIPSQFNQDSLYRRDNRQRDASQNYRRLSRLVLGLALVIVVMQKASQPAMYQTFFDPSQVNTPSQTDGFTNRAGTLARGELPNRPNGETSQDENGRRNTGPPGEAPQGWLEGQPNGSIGFENPPQAVDQRIANAIVEELPPTDQRLWMVALARWQSGGQLPVVPSSIESISAQISSMPEITPEQRDPWRNMLQAYSDAAAESTTTPSPENPQDSDAHPLPSQRPQVNALLAALDNAANARVVDGSVWRAGDFDSLYRFLEQSYQLPQRGVASTGVIPLLQQPDVFRNQWVRISGDVVRTERITAQDNAFGFQQYWQIWIRPNDGADRPLVVIVPQIPDSVAAISPDMTNLEGPEIVVVGKYLKRLAYRSGLGADVAPVVVGQITSAPISQSERDQLREASSPEQLVPIWIPILLATILGIASASLVMWRTSASAKRSRALRTAKLPARNGFLRELGQERRLGQVEHPQTQPDEER